MGGEVGWQERARAKAGGSTEVRQVHCAPGQCKCILVNAHHSACICAVEAAITQPHRALSNVAATRSIRTWRSAFLRPIAPVWCLHDPAPCAVGVGVMLLCNFDAGLHNTKAWRGLVSQPDIEREAARTVSAKQQQRTPAATPDAHTPGCWGATSCAAHRACLLGVPKGMADLLEGRELEHKLERKRDERDCPNQQLSAERAHGDRKVNCGEDKGCVCNARGALKRSERRAGVSSKNRPPKPRQGSRPPIVLHSRNLSPLPHTNSSCQGAYPGERGVRTAKGAAWPVGECGGCLAWGSMCVLELSCHNAHAVCIAWG